MEPLIGALEAYKAQAGDEFDGSVLFRVDRSVVFRVIMKLLVNAAQAGYPSFETAVTREGDGSGWEGCMDMKNAPPRLPSESDVGRIKLVLLVKTDGYVLATTAGDRTDIPASSGALDAEALERALAERRKLEPERRDIVVAAREDVPHGEVVRVFDLALEHGFEEISLSDGSTPGHGSMSKEVIRRVIRRHINEVRYCHEQAMADSDSTIDGRVSVSFSIGPTGTVTRAEVVHETTGSQVVATCIRDAVTRWTFPAPEGGGAVIVTYPFVLKSVAEPEQ